MRTDPRLRQTWNQITDNVEVVADSAQANLFSFSQIYLGPCFASLDACAQSCIAPCFPGGEERLRRSRGRTRGRAEYSFDFYDDWDEDDGSRDALLGWDNDELDRLLAGSGSQGEGGQPPRRRERTMTYGTAIGDREGRRPSGRRKTNLDPPDGRPDPTVIPSNAVFGFLERLPWKIGGKGRRYRPSAADLQDRPGAAHQERASVEGEPLLEEDEDKAAARKDGERRRKRSNTSGSEETTDSLSSRGDLFPSDDEDDAIPLDDEFAMVLERRTTNSGNDDASSRRKRKGKRPSGSRTSVKTGSSRGTRKSSTQRRGSSVSMSDDLRPDAASVEGLVEVPSVTDLKMEEERIRRQEEEDVERKRRAAKKLAMKRGLSFDELNKVRRRRGPAFQHWLPRLTTISLFPMKQSPIPSSCPMTRLLHPHYHLSLHRVRPSRNTCKQRPHLKDLKRLSQTSYQSAHRMQHPNSYPLVFLPFKTPIQLHDLEALPDSHPVLDTPYFFLAPAANGQ